MVLWCENVCGNVVENPCALCEQLMTRNHRLFCLGLLSIFCFLSPAPARAETDVGAATRPDPFRQLDTLLPTPNTYRTASGAPGHQYWQQQVDYTIDVTLDDQTQEIRGSERIKYSNHSPDTLTFLWLQLDANIYRPDADAVLTATAPELNRVSFERLQSWLARETFDGGVRIESVQDADAKALSHTVVKTMMRVDLPEPLVPGKSFVFSVQWHYRINNARLVRGRTGYEHFDEDGNNIYEIAQWFPRLAPYTDVAWVATQAVSGER